MGFDDVARVAPLPRDTETRRGSEGWLLSRSYCDLGNRICLGHLPVARVLSPTLTAPLVAYVIIANALFGVVAGYLYWRRGLESAVIAHMLAHVVMLCLLQNGWRLNPVPRCGITSR